MSRDPTCTASTPTDRLTSCPMSPWVSAAPSGQGMGERLVLKVVLFKIPLFAGSCVGLRLQRWICTYIYRASALFCFFTNMGWDKTQLPENWCWECCSVCVPHLKAQELRDSQNLSERKKIPQKLDLQMVLTRGSYKFHLGNLSFIWKTQIILNGNLFLVEPWKCNGKSK